MEAGYRREEDTEVLARLAALPEQSPHPVLELDSRGLIYANPAALALWPDLPERGEEHPLVSASREIGSGAGEVELESTRYRLDVSTSPQTGRLLVYVADSAASRGRLLYHVVEHAADALFLHDREGNILEVNRSACESLGYGREELLSFRIQDIEENLDAEELSLMWERLTPDEPVTVDGLHRRKDGSTFPAEVRLILFEERGKTLMLALARDVTERKEAQRLLVESERCFRQLFERSTESIFVHDTEGRIVDCNVEACSSLGYTREELLSLSVGDFALDVLSEEERRRREDTPWRRAVRAGPGVQMAFHKNEHRCKDGTTFPVEVGIGAVDYGEERLVLASARDISGRRLLERELEHRATHDPLTGLPNREMLEDSLRRSLPEAERRGESLAVMFVHLGGLEEARDRLGHREGDRLLTEVATRIRGCLGLEDMVCRPGGDELAILVESAPDGDQAEQAALDILEELRPPLAEGEFQPEVTLGVALASPGDDGPGLIDEAYSALCRARRAGEPYELSS